MNGDNMSKKIVTKGKNDSASKGVSKLKATITGRRVAISKNATGNQILNTMKISKASKKVGRSAVSKSKKKAR